MSEEKVDGTIKMPTMGYEGTVDTLCKKLIDLNNKAEAVNIFNPLSTFRLLEHLAKSRKDLTLEYNDLINHCYERLQQPVNGAPGFLAASVQAWSNAKGTSLILKLQNTWNEFGAVLDRKYAYSFAILSLYVAISSLLLSIFFFIITL